jgi:hypothetical protein
MELTLGNPTCPGCGSSADISLIPPHAFSVTTSFSYFNGCDGTGTTCASADCSTAFFVPDDNQVQVACQADNVDLLITFCGDATEVVKSGFQSAQPAAPAASSSPPPVKAAPSSAPAATPTAQHSSSAAAAAPSSAAVIGVESAPAVSSSASASSSAASASGTPTRKTCKRSSPGLGKKRKAKRSPSPAPVAPEALKAHKRLHARHLESDLQMH